jgi:pantoate--beta-alanine ligase
LRCPSRSSPATPAAPSGLALSSRNGYLSAEQRAQAVQLSQALQALAQAALAGSAPLPQLEAQAMQALQAQGWAPTT